MPRVFIITTHGSMPMIDVAEPVVYQAPIFAAAAAAAASKAKKKTKTKTKLVSSAADSAPAADSALAIRGLKIKKPDYFKVPVDTFTTARCGHPFCADLRCDEPFVGLVHELSQHRLLPNVQKDKVRQLIQHAMTGIRSDPRQAYALTMGENTICCHKKGHYITDLFLFGPNHALPVIESVTMVDMVTGEIRDAHDMFGLVVKPSVSSTIHEHAVAHTDRMPILRAAKLQAEYDLRTLQGAHPFYVKTKQEHIKAIDDTMNDRLNESKFEYLKAKHGARVKLSHLLQIGVDNGVIDPKNDVVVVYACRVPDELPPGVILQLDRPHGNEGSESDASVGGTRTRSKQQQKGKSKQRYRRKTCKRRN